MDEQLHPAGTWETDEQADLERAFSETTMDEQSHPAEQCEFYEQAYPERAYSDTRAVAGSESSEWEMRRDEEAD